MKIGSPWRASGLSHCALTKGLSKAADEYQRLERLSVVGGLKLHIKGIVIALVSGTALLELLVLSERRPWHQEEEIQIDSARIGDF